MLPILYVLNMYCDVLHEDASPLRGAHGSKYSPRAAGLAAPSCADGGGFRTAAGGAPPACGSSWAPRHALRRYPCGRRSRPQPPHSSGHPASSSLSETPFIDHQTRWQAASSLRIKAASFEDQAVLSRTISARCRQLSRILIRFSYMPSNLRQDFSSEKDADCWLSRSSASSWNVPAEGLTSAAHTKGSRCRV